MQRDGQVTDFVSEVYRHKTRERIWIRENAHLVRADDGTPLYYEGTVEDITRQRHTELALQASERRFRAFTERSQVLTVVCDAQGVRQLCQPGGAAAGGLCARGAGGQLHLRLAASGRPGSRRARTWPQVLDFSNDQRNRSAASTMPTGSGATWRCWPTTAWPTRRWAAWC